MNQASALPRSPWTEAAQPALETPPLEGEERADVAIVGAGFTGLSAALHLAQKGVDVVILEAVEPGFGASGRNGGQVIPGLKHDPEEIIETFGPERGEQIVEMVGGAAEVVCQLIEKHAIACDLRRAGWLQCAHGNVALPGLERRARQWSSRGAPVDVIDAAETRRRSGARGYVGALFDGRGATLNPLAYVRGLARAACECGARIHGHSPVHSLERDRQRDSHWRLATPSGVVRADRVLLATNAYADDLRPNVSRSIIPVNSYQIATAPLGGDLGSMILPGGLGMSDARRLVSYCRQDAQGRLLVGGRGRRHESTNPADFGTIVRAMGRLFPDAAGLPVEYWWSGRVALTLHHYPHIGEIAPGLAVALGYNGRGVALATAVGREMAEHLAGRPLKDLPLPLRPMRPLPLHGLRAPALSVAVAFKRLQDWWEAAE